MKVLLACEESQAVTIAFRNKGHEAYSCDLLPCSGGHPEWHIQRDVTSMLYGSKLKVEGLPYDDGFDLVISFPPCTDLAVSGARWFEKKRLSGEQEASIEFFFHVWYYSHCTENPIGIMGGGEYIKKWFTKLYDKMIANRFPFKPSQIIQPWQFGHTETKATCLWLNNLPQLSPTNILGPMPIGNTRTEKLMIKRQWNKVHRCVPSPDRSVIRSKTYTGIAAAMAEQWGNL
jgi:hypothetical protein